MIGHQAAILHANKRKNRAQSGVSLKTLTSLAVNSQSQSDVWVF
jgi:hypothetical protein